MLRFFNLNKMRFLLGDAISCLRQTEIRKKKKEGTQTARRDFQLKFEMVDLNLT